MTADRQSSINIIIGRDYPLPIVNHSIQRELALSLYKNQQHKPG